MEIDRIAQYLAGMSYSKAEEIRPGARPYPFIAVSRQTGAGGHSLAQAILRAMAKRPGSPLLQGWQVFDREICRQVLENPKLKVLMDSLLAEKFRTGVGDALTHAIAGTSYQDAVTHEIFQVVKDVAALGKSIIIGRGAASLMRRHPGGVFVRLVAPRSWRIASIRARLNISKEAAEKRVKEGDSDRARFVRHYFGQNIDDPFLYDCVWNMGRVPVETAADAVIGMVEARAKSAAAFFMVDRPDADRQDGDDKHYADQR